VNGSERVNQLPALDFFAKQGLSKESVKEKD
jgi:hypothetical protein